MFGFSIGKLLVLVAVVAAVWVGFRLFARSGRRDAPPPDAAIDTEYDPETDSYVAKRTRRDRRDS